MSAASRALRVDPATVGRRINSLESALTLRCFERRADGYRLTDGGRKLLEHAERVETDLLGLSRAIDGEDRHVCGLVSVTASDSVTLPFLIPVLPGMRERHPDLRIDLISTNRVLSLARREADIAVRMVRPEEGDLLARRIATMGYGLYASPEYLGRAGMPETLDDLKDHALVDWLEEYPRAAVSAWFRKLADGTHAALRLNGAQERLSAVTAGVGIACMGYIMARGRGLCRVLPDVEVPPLELWLVVHPDSARVKRVRAVMDYLVEAAAAASGRFSRPE